MPLLILGFVFVVGLFLYYLASTNTKADFDETDSPDLEDDEDIKKEENVIFITGDIESMKEKYKNKK